MARTKPRAVRPVSPRLRMAVGPASSAALGGRAGCIWSSAWRLSGTWGGRDWGGSIFPVVDAGQFRLRLRAPDGTHIAKTEQIAKDVLDLIDEEVGRGERRSDAGLCGHDPLQLPDQRRLPVVARARGSHPLRRSSRTCRIRVEQLKERLRDGWRAEMPDVRFSFEPADIVNEVMSFGSPTPVDVAVSGPNFAENRSLRREGPSRNWPRSRLSATCSSASRWIIRRSKSMSTAKKRASSA